MRQIREWDSDSRLTESGFEWSDRDPRIGTFFYWMALGGFALMGFALLNSDKSMAMIGFGMSVVCLPLIFLHRKKYAIIFHRNGATTAPYGIVSAWTLRNFPGSFFELQVAMRPDEEAQAQDKTRAAYEVILASRQGLFYKLRRYSDHDSAFFLVTQINLAKNAMLDSMSEPYAEE